LACLLGVLAVVLLIVFRPAEQPVPSATESSAPPAVIEEQPVAPAESVAPAEPTVCTDADVVVTAVTDVFTYAAGVAPQLSWTVSNVGGAPCIIDVGTAQQTFTITSGSDEIWRSTDCQSDGTEFLLTLEPGATPTSSASIPWDRTRSSPDTCDSERAPVAAGGASYHLEVTIGGIASTDTRQFILN